MPPNASLLVIEQVLGGPNTDFVLSAESDVAMMVLPGGKERTRAGFAALREEAAGITPPPSAAGPARRGYRRPAG